LLWEKLGRIALKNIFYFGTGVGPGFSLWGALKIEMV